MQVLEKYRLNFKINEDVDETEFLAYKELIAKFQHFLKKNKEWVYSIAKPYPTRSVTLPKTESVVQKLACQVHC